MKRKKKSRGATSKENIQALLRERVIERDGGCVLRLKTASGECGGYTNDGDLILQAEHLNGRANSVSYAELDNIVCLCMRHHIFFKRQNPALYWILIRQVLGEKRWGKVQAWILDRSPHRVHAAEWEAKEKALSQKD